MSNGSERIAESTVQQRAVRVLSSIAGPATVFRQVDALAQAGLLADGAAAERYDRLLAAVEAIQTLCDDAEYVVLAADDPGCPPVKAVAVIDVLSALAAVDDSSSEQDGGES